MLCFKRLSLTSLVVKSDQSTNAGLLALNSRRKKIVTMLFVRVRDEMLCVSLCVPDGQICRSVNTRKEVYGILLGSRTSFCVQR